MGAVKTIWDCMFGPKLIKIYGNLPVQNVYQPHTLERWGDRVIHSLYVFWKIGVYTSPFIVGILYQRGYFSIDGLAPLTKFITSIGVILVVSYCCKGLGRYNNPTYRKFLTVVKEAQIGLSKDVKKQLSLYEFDFDHWPVEFDMHDLNKDLSKRKSASSSNVPHNLVQYLTSLPFRIIAYFAIHTFGIRLIYPGTISILQMILEQTLQQGRARLIEDCQGERFKLRTIDNNDIDTMLIDKRNKGGNGNVLVICCEGNAGFYEIGIMITPIEAGYSALGWNHPGFANSTGKPYPDQEQNAIDTVMQFAINELGYKLENIMVFGWSIGGYSSCWAAMSYPDIKGAVVDASFDDILPLAVNHMPRWWEPIVKIAIREFVNLNIQELLVKYPGPVLLFRRSEDEVICLKENDLSSNRGNNLLIKLLKARYPHICGDVQMEVLNTYLSVTAGAQDSIVQKFGVDENICHSLIESYISNYSKSYPMKIGEAFKDFQKNQMILFLARKYLKDFKASHCVNLPAEMFQPPWDVNVESDFVFT